MEKTLLTAQAAKSIGDILHQAFHLKPEEKVLVIFDHEAPLTEILTEAYRRNLPTGDFIDFAQVTAADILQKIDSLKPDDLVILVQSANFRLNEFRFRIELFKRELKTIEHVHLARLSETEFERYIAALAYDSAYYRTLGPALKAKLDKARRTVVACDGTELVYEGPLEDAKLNIGDYRGMKNIGGLFPIGEVFTEARDLTSVNGTAKVFAFAGDDHVVRLYEPFLVEITRGILTAPDAPAEFKYILSKIKEEEGVLVRELGFGLNPAMGKTKVVSDISAFERQKGVHVSLGAKHAMYPKPGLKRKEGRYHVDIFLDVTQILIDQEVVFRNGDFLVQS